MVMRLPRNVRDKIYKELLVSKLSPKDQAECDQMTKAAATQSASVRLNVADKFLQLKAIMPGSAQNYPFITQALGLLLSCKQLHVEANNVLFSENTFVVMPENERVHCFWRCDNYMCQPGVPCFIHKRNFERVKHLYIIVVNPCKLEEKAHDRVAAILRKNLEPVVRCFVQAGNQLESLRIRYTSCLQGQIEDMREDLDALGNGSAETRPVVIGGSGTGHCLHPGDDISFLFRNCDVLDCLKGMGGIAEEVTVWGDLPGAQIEDLEQSLCKNKTKATVKKAKKPEQRKDDFAEFMQMLAEESPNDRWMQALCDKLKGRPIRSPAVMAELMKPPTAEELRRLGSMR